MRDILLRLQAEMSPTGHESAAADLWRTYVGSFSADVHGDALGNSIARLGDGPVRVMLAGHIDEIGFQIHNVDKEGFLWFCPLGGWDPQVFVGQRVIIRGKDGELVHGVIAKKAIHLQDEKERKANVKVEDLWIDIGATDKDDALSVVDVWDAGVVACDDTRELRNGIWVSRAWDDRIGAGIVACVLDQIHMVGVPEHLSVFGVATTQEEIGLVGAIASAFGIDPHFGIATDVGFASDTPGLEKAKHRVNDVTLGGGALVAGGPNLNPKFRDLIVKTAETHNIPIQKVAWERPTGTDARAIQVTRKGVVTGLISIPNRYMHSPNELVHEGDVEKVIDLMARSVLAIPNSDEQFML